MGNRFTSEPIDARFWRKVQKTDGCWLWRGSADSQGYGQIREFGRRGRLLKTHRVSWVIANGSIPDGLNVLHRCDVPACVRPDHLFLGTLADNSQDAARKGRLVFQRHPERRPIGERGGGSRLTDAQAVEIRARYAAGGCSQPSLAREYGVSQAAIWYVLHRRQERPTQPKGPAE